MCSSCLSIRLSAAFFFLVVLLPFLSLAALPGPCVSHSVDVDSRRDATASNCMFFCVIAASVASLLHVSSSTAAVIDVLVVNATLAFMWRSSVRHFRLPSAASGALVVDAASLLIACAAAVFFKLLPAAVIVPKHVEKYASLFLSFTSKCGTVSLSSPKKSSRTTSGTCMSPPLSHTFFCGCPSLDARQLSVSGTPCVWQAPPSWKIRDIDTLLVSCRAHSG